ncbi:iron-containing redox enzyme family protein [Dactylosporangium roseum]|uniref:Iron-containing redox enzyme family protein n=1 Tax=Dactylosporangium roseum TaxID=47989 RepID=A0ABY5YXQ0_9ACTN|nr:iron-containing redox enzyme family protein [Dactylosporangium roseum]UWZ34540.1 iron-containing redox enzyme family protein [Dactylosporangium roseum]
MQMPHPRGPLSAALLRALDGAPHELPDGLAAMGTAAGDPLADEDLQLTLHVCYELHYQGFDGVDEGWEWHPSLLALRQAAERRFEAALRRLVPLPAPVPPGELPRALVALVEADDGPQLSKYLAGRATADQFREFVMHRSIYHLREADPHTWAVPRLAGRAKAALIEIQADEYGGGRAERMHAELFRITMRALGLDSAYGAYLDAVPAVTLATNNLMSLFGLHRRLLGAVLGHLAVFEMTSSLPNRRYGNGLRRLGGNADATRFYDEHVEADAVHEQIAVHDLCGAFCAGLPSQRRAEQTSLVLFGAACALALDGRFAGHLLRRWAAGGSSLRDQPRSSGRLVVGALGA